MKTTTIMYSKYAHHLHVQCTCTVPTHTMIFKHHQWAESYTVELAMQLKSMNLHIYVTLSV